MKSLSPEHIMFIRNLIDPGNNGKIVCKHGVDVSIALAMFRVVLPDNHLIEDRITQRRPSSNVSNLAASMIVEKELRDSTFYLFIGGTLSKTVADDINRINQESLKTIGTYKVLLVGGRTNPALYQYDWVISDSEDTTVSYGVKHLLNEYIKTVPMRKDRLSVQKMFMSAECQSNMDTLIRAAEAFATSDLNTSVGKIALQISTCVSAVSANRFSIFINSLAHCMVGTLLNEKELEASVKESDPDKFTLAMPQEFVRLYYNKLTDIYYQVDMMNMFAYKADYTDMLSVEGRSVYIIFGVDGCASAHAATIWLRQHPEVDVLIAWDLRKPNTITFRTLRDDITMYDIAKPYFTELDTIGTLGALEKMVRLKFDPTGIVITGNIAGKERGFGGTRICSSKK